jgi:hypothetical protein
VHQYPHILILEDDIALPGNLAAIIDACMPDFIYRNGDMLSLGSTNNWSYVETPGKAIHYTPGLTTRCCHAIIYSLECVQKIMSDPWFSVVDQPIDHKLNDIIRRLKIKHFWYEPGIPQKDYDTYSNLKRFR